MSQSEKPFSVSDRRHFTAEGQPREEGGEGAPEPSGTPGSAKPASPESAAEDDGTPLRAPAGPVELGQFLLSLGAQAGMLLAEAAGADAAKADAALDGARSIISILEMLNDKTEGRRTPEEDRVIEGLLFELRMAYVERSRVRKR